MEGPNDKPPTANDTIQLQLTSLTPELKCAIFTNLPDVASAKSLALTSSSFYYTFLGAESLIITQVLQNEITTDLMHGAFAAYKASKISVWTKQAVKNFLDEYFGDLAPHKAQIWTLSEALPMNKVHSCVNFFAADFASFALSKNPIPGDSSAAPSCTETLRIKRSLYRFELYCNLFRKPSYDRMVRGDRNCLIQPSPFGTQEQRDIFLNMFSPWENEQLGCIHDYLIEKITVPFNDVAEHDVNFGELSIAWVDTFGNKEEHYKNDYLLLGLDFVSQLSTARTYDDRHRLLTSNQGYKGSRLSDAMRPSWTLQDDGVPLEEYNDEEEKHFVNAPFHHDDDSGPAEAWRWAHAKSTKQRFYFLKEHRLFRQRGYVMWDLKRLLGWNLFALPVQALASERSLSGLERLEKQAEEMKQEKMQSDSWRERSRIWQEGGDGWWAPGDESHIRWPRGHQESQVSSIPK